MIANPQTTTIKISLPLDAPNSDSDYLRYRIEESLHFMQQSTSHPASQTDYLLTFKDNKICSDAIAFLKERLPETIQTDMIAPLMVTNNSRNIRPTHRYIPFFSSLFVLIEFCLFIKLTSLEVQFHLDSSPSPIKYKLQTLHSYGAFSPQYDAKNETVYHFFLKDLIVFM